MDEGNPDNKLAKLHIYAGKNLRNTAAKIHACKEFVLLV